MSILGLIFEIIGVVILALQPQVTLWDTGTRPAIMWVNFTGWGFMLVGFGLMLISELWAIKRGVVVSMDNQRKKILAREGLIIIAILVFGALIIGINILCNNIFVKHYVNTPQENAVGWQIISYAHYDLINRLGFMILLLGYPLYLIIRFIFWAIRTLRNS